MKPIAIKEITEEAIQYAKNQLQYGTLPGYKHKDNVIACWSLNWKERLNVLLGGRIFVSLKMFRKPLTPSYLSTTFEEIKRVE